MRLYNSFVKILGAVALTFVLAQGALAEPPTTSPAAGTPPDIKGGAAGVKAYSYADMVEKLLPAVVNVSSTQIITDKSQQGEGGLPEGMLPQFPPGSPFEDFFKDFMQRHGNQPQQRTQASLGSGFIIDADKGYVVTNNHVVADADEVNIILQDNVTLKAKLIGTDTKTDLAVLQVDVTKHKLTAVPFGDSDKWRVGDPVVAIGNPFGLGGTVTTGIISARGRNISAGPYDDFLQTDAAINRGNSGGPMFDLNGEVIGVNTAIFSPSGGSVGIGFAIPSALVEPVVKQIIKFGHTTRGWLGVHIQQVTDDIAENLGTKSTKGALVAAVTDGGPAAAVDIQKGDIITKFNGKDIVEMRQLPRIVAETPVNTEVPIEIFRRGQTIAKTIKVGELEKAEKSGTIEGLKKEDSAPVEKNADAKLLGMSFGEATPAVKQQFGIKGKINGVIVTEVAPGSNADDKHIQPGDVIAEVNQQAVTTPAEVFERVGKARRDGRHSALFLVERKGNLSFISLSLDEAKPVVKTPKTGAKPKAGKSELPE